MRKFEPPVGAQFVRYDEASESYSPFPLDRENEIRDVLTEFIKQRIRTASWVGKPTGKDRFLTNALLAIADYEAQRDMQARFDRAKAKVQLDELAVNLTKTIDSLQRVSEWRELDQYLEDVFDDLPGGSIEEKPKTNRKASLKQIFANRDAMAKRYKKYSPFHVSMELRTLKDIVAIAAGQVAFGYGDARRDAIAQRFANELAFAWGSGTGKAPTYSRPNHVSVKPSPFASMLHLINTHILKPEHRSQNGFREYGVKAVKEIKRITDPKHRT